MVDGEEQGQQEQHQAADEFDDPLEELVAEEIINCNWRRGRDETRKSDL